jgi:hypothetical protein
MKLAAQAVTRRMIMNERPGGPVKLFQQVMMQTIVVASCALALVACDDSAPSGPTGAGGAGASGGSGGMGGTAGMGGTGGTGGMMDILCAQDSQCPDGTYCAIEDGGIGRCLPGCSDDEGCEGDQVCDPETNECQDPPCESDADCPDDATYCRDGECLEGCRNPGDACADTDEQGRGTVCDEETRLCVALFPCCTGLDECVALLPSACEAMGGVTLQGSATCANNPCGVPCSDNDDCGDDLGRFCNPDDMRCGDGCRDDDPNSCDRGQLCDPDTHLCIDLDCGNDMDCAEDRYCDLEDGRGLCVPGCREDANCPDGERCLDNVCVQFCDPADADACGEGRYCAENMRCEDICNEHADCPNGLFCEADTGICRGGCRDDEGATGEPNNDQATATGIELSAPDAQGRQFGSIEGRILCDDNADVFRVDVPAGARVRVDVQFNEGTPNFSLDGRSGNCENNADCAEALEWVCEERACAGPSQDAEGRDQHAYVEYPGLNELVQDEASYYITVAPTNQRVVYRVDVAVVDARTGCFPDRFEQDGNDNRNQAVRLESGYADTLAGTICDGDEDWFVISADPNDGLSLNLRSLTGEDVNLFLFAADQDRGAPVLTAGARSDLVDYPQGTSFFVPGGDWFVLVTGRTPETSAEYQLDVLHTPSVFDCGDDDQGDTVATSAQLMIGVGEEIDAGETLMSELAICNADGPDVDMFCLEVGDGEVLSAAIVLTDQNAMAGRARVQIVDEAGNVQGSDAVNTIGDARDWAVTRGTVAGTYCARVAGLNRTQGVYTLHVRRSDNMAAMCGLDEDEADGPRNDRAAQPTPMNDVAGDGSHYIYENGYLCDADRPDEDWYSFSIAEANSALCIRLDGFSADRADADLGVYPAVGSPDGPDCTARGQAECDDAGGGACIVGDGGRSYCTPALGRSASGFFDFELINVRRNVFRERAGDYLIRVHHNDENEGPYLLDITVTPPENVCGADAQEPNNQAQDATFLGSGQVATCSSWLCEENQNGEEDEDWYDIVVPAGEDRTVIVNYSNLTEGRVYMDAVGPDQPMDEGSGRVESRIRAGNAQCINIQGGVADATISLELFSGAMAPVNDLLRLDYSLRVVPTNLDMNPSGACVRLGANDMGDCGPREEWEFFGRFGRIQPENCWPTIVVP